jgi:hypothetical protein
VVCGIYWWEVLYRLKAWHKRFVCVGLLVWLLLAFVASLNLQFGIQEANATESGTIVDSNISGAYAYAAIRLPKQHKLFYAVGRYWYWYCTGSQIGFKTSTDGSSWSSFTSIATENTAAYFDVSFDGTKVSYVRAYSYGTNVYYRRGTPNADGSITWDANEQFVLTNTNYPADPSICVDSNGYPWIVFRLASQPNYPIIVTSSYNNGSWSTKSGYPMTLINRYYYLPSIFPLLDGQLYAIYAQGTLSATPDYIYGRLYNGTAWQAETQISTSKVATDYWQEWDALSDVYGNGQVVFIKTSTHQIIYIKRDNVTGNWGSEEQVYASVGDSLAVSISYFSGMTYCFWNGYPTASHYYYSKRESGVWDSAVDWIDDSTDGQPNKRNLVTSGNSYNGEILVGWLAKSTSPYTAKFAKLTVQDTIAPTYSNIAHSTTTVGVSCTFSCKWQDNIALSGYVFSWNGTGTWQNNTWTALTGNPAWANVTKTLPSNPGTVVGYKWYCNDASDNWNETSINTLTTTPASSYPTYDPVSVSHNTTVANEPCEFSSEWYDDVGLSGYILSTNVTTSTVNTAISSSSSDGGAYNQGVSYSTVRTASTASSIFTSASYIALGQYYEHTSLLYFIYRGYLYFDTSTIPSWATITSVTLSIYIKSDYSTTDFNATIVNGQPVYPHDPLVSTDYYYGYYSGTGGTKSTSTITGLGYWNITLTSTGIGWITKEGITKLCLRSSRDINGDTPTMSEEFIQFYSNEQGASYAPKLYITYQAWVNETWTSLSGTVDTATTVLTLPSTIGQIVGYRWYCNDTDDQWTITSIYVLTTINSNLPTYSNIGYNTTVVSTLCLFSVELADDYGLSGYVFSTNNTGAWVNDSWVDLSGVLSAWANVTKTLNSNVGMEVVFRWYINDTHNNLVTTTIGILILTTTGSAYPYYSSVSYNTTIINMPCKFTVKWMDDVGLSGYIFSYNPTGSGWTNNSWTSLTGTNQWVYNTKTLPSIVGTTVRFRWYCNDTDNQWTITSIFTLLTTEYHYYFSWNYKDLDAYTVDSYVTWKLYQGVNLISYTKGQATLTSGTYTLKAYYLANLINETTLPTGTYGNQTLSLTLQMKEHSIVSHGYIAFNQKISSITITKATSDELRFTVVGDYSDYIIIVAVAQNASSVQRNGVNQTGWTYNSSPKYVKITVANLLLASWSLNFPPYVPPTPTPPSSALDQILGLLQFLWAGDYFGFIMAIYTFTFGSVDIFFGILAFAITMIAYIRVKSLLFLSIAWILVGTVFLAAMPFISAMAILFLALGIASALFQLFMFSRSQS